MRRLMFSIVCVVLFGASALAEAQRALPFDKAQFEAGINAAFNAKDANAVGKYLASNYNEGGVSKDMAIRQLAELFQKADVQVRIRIVDFHQFGDTHYGSARFLTEMTVNNAGGPRRSLRTAGYVGMVNENGQWELVSNACGVQNRPVPGPSGTPPVDINKSDIDWAGWGSAVNPASIGSDLISESNRPAFSPDFGQSAPNRTLPKFDNAKWESGFMTAWNRKDADAILRFYTPYYTEFGLDVKGIKAALNQTFEAYDRIDCKYRVLSISYIPNSNLASIKAVLDLRGALKGTTDLKPILQVAGYASLIATRNQWKVYAVQTTALPDIGSTSWEELITKQWPLPLN